MTHETVRVIYDGDCPICRRYTQYVELRRRFDLELVDAREEPGLVASLTAQGIDIDDGFVVVQGGRTLQGARAAEWIEENTTDAGPLDRLKKRAMRSRHVADLLYRAMWWTRIGLYRLILRREPRINAQQPAD